MSIREAMEKADAALSAADVAPEQAPVTTSITPAPEAPVTTTTEAPVAAVETTTAPSLYARDESGRFAPKPKDGKEAATKEPAQAPEGVNGAASGAPPAGQGKPDGAASPPAPSGEPVAAAEPIKAPQSLRPVAREEWARVPRPVQEDIARREKETSLLAQQAAEHRKAYEAFQSVVAPYERVIRDSGASHPLQFVQNLFQTASVLRYGTDHEKASAVAQVIKNFGVNVETLAAQLHGTAPAQPQTVDPRALVRQAKTEWMQELQELAARQQEYRFRDMEARFAEAHEGYYDVMPIIANIVAGRGIDKNSLTEQQLQEFYDLARTIDPQWSTVLKQREAAKSAGTAQAATQRAKNAASSVKSTPAAAPLAAQPKGIRSAMEKAAADLGWGRE